MTERKVVRLLVHQGLLNAGEVAEFDADYADRLIASGRATEMPPLQAEGQTAEDLGRAQRVKPAGAAVTR